MLNKVVVEMEDTYEVIVKENSVEVLNTSVTDSCEVELDNTEDGLEVLEYLKNEDWKGLVLLLIELGYLD